MLGTFSYLQAIPCGNVHSFQWSPGGSLEWMSQSYPSSSGGSRGGYDASTGCDGLVTVLARRVLLTSSFMDRCECLKPFHAREARSASVSAVMMSPGRAMEAHSWTTMVADNNDRCCTAASRQATSVSNSTESESGDTSSVYWAKAALVIDDGGGGGGGG